MSRRTLSAIAVATAVGTPLALWALLASNHPVASKYALATIGIVIGVAFIGCGVVARIRRPENLTGLLMIAVGFGWYLSAFSQANNPVVYTFGSLVGALTFGFLIHLVVAFPSGRLESTFARAIVIVGYVLVVGINATSVFLTDLHSSCGADCPRNVALVYHDEGLASVLLVLFATTAVALAVAIVVLLVRRWRRASVAMRRALLPVFLAGGATLAASAIDLAFTSAAGHETVVYWLVLGIFLSVPLAFLFGLLRSRLAGASVARLLAANDAGIGPYTTEASLREALGDPELRLGFWYADSGGFVDGDGAALTLDSGDGRYLTELRDESGEPLAAVLHDVALLDEPGRLGGALGAARLGLQRDKLQAELRARVADLEAAQAQLRRSRSRIVAAASEERRRLERNLHDGAQQRLVSVSLTMRLAQAKLRSDPETSAAILDDAATELTLALDELRELARGLHPAMLTERGLEAAVRALAERAPLPVELDVELEGRLPDDVEVALFYVISESLTNVAKYAHASLACVRVTAIDGVARAEISDDGVGGATVGGGTGLRGLADRVEALDGTLTVVSSPGDGTFVTAELPLRA